MQEAYFYVNALPTRCLIISGIEKGIQSGLAAGTLTVQLIWASWLLRYGKECTHASHSKPYCDTGLPAAAYKSAGQLLLVGRILTEEEELGRSMAQSHFLHHST